MSRERYKIPREKYNEPETRSARRRKHKNATFLTFLRISSSLFNGVGAINRTARSRAAAVDGLAALGVFMGIKAVTKPASFPILFPHPRTAAATRPKGTVHSFFEPVPQSGILPVQASPFTDLIFARFFTTAWERERPWHDREELTSSAVSSLALHCWIHTYSCRNSYMEIPKLVLLQRNGAT